MHVNSKRNSRRRALAVITCFALVGAACGSDDDKADSTVDSSLSATETTASDVEPDPSEPPTVTSPGSTSAGTTPAGGDSVVTTPTTGGSDTVVGEPGGTATYGVEQEFTAYNNDAALQVLYANTRVLNMVQPSVFITNPDLTLTLFDDMMESVEVTSADPQVVVYKIRPVAVWQDGEPIDCDDFYLEWLSGNDTASNGVDDDGEPIPVFDTASTTGYEDIESLECSADGFTITTTYSRVFPDYKSLFANLLPAHVVEEIAGVADLTAVTDQAEIEALGDAWNTGFIGFDPARALSGAWYKIDQFNPGETLILTRNERFYGEPGLLDEIVFRLIPSGDDQPSALANGDVQVITPQPEPDLLAQLEGVEMITADVVGGVSFEHLDFNQANPILADVNVRKAIALCIDRNELVDTLIRPLDPDFEVLNNRMFVPSSPGYVDNGAGYEVRDVDAAKALLEESGWVLGDDGVYAKDGTRLSLRVGRRDPNPRRQSVNELIAAQCIDAGIELTDDPAEDFNSIRLPASDYDIALFAWVATAFHSSNTPIYVPGGEQNWNSYANPAVQELFDRANVEFDDAKRAELMNEIDRIIWDDMATLPLFQFPNLYAYSDSLSGVVYNDPQSVTWNANQWAIVAS